MTSKFRKFEKLVKKFHPFFMVFYKAAFFIWRTIAMIHWFRAAIWAWHGPNHYLFIRVMGHNQLPLLICSWRVQNTS